MGKSSRQTSDIRTIVFLIIGGIMAIVLYLLLSSSNGFTSKFVKNEATTQDSVSRYSNRKDQNIGGYYAYKEREVETFMFDPNTADSTALLRLGLAPFQVRGIYKYRAMGGVYHQAEDFARVPGLTVKDYKRLAPYIAIGEDFKLAANVISRPVNMTPRDTTAYPKKLQSGQMVSINRADTNALKHVPGIGSYYARAAIRYREQLGGFASKSQLMEIEGFPEQALDFISVDTTRLRHININRASLEELRRHPYLRYYRAKRIIDYRRIHGAIHTLRQLLPAPEFTEEIIHSLEPYVEY